MALTLESNCLVCKRSSEIFNVLSEQELEKVDCNKSSLNYRPGEIIFKQGAPSNYFVCITSGLVKLYLEHQNNHNLIIGLILPINYIFEPGPFVDQHHHVTAVAVEDTTACLIDRKVMQDLITGNSGFAMEFIRKVSLQSVRLFNCLSSCSQKHVYGRVADVLLYMHPEIYPENPFELTLSRQELADISGMTKESLIRVLKKFKEDKIISLDGNTMEILNRDMLSMISRKG